MRKHRIAIPHSAQSVKTEKYGTRFPSVEAHFKQKGERMYNIFSGGALGKRSLPTSHKLTTAHLNNVPVHLSCYPITEADAKLAESTGSLYQLRERHDQLTYESRMKRKQLDALRQDVAEREKQDAFTEKCIRNGEAMMIELEQRLRQVQQALTEARRTHAFYKEILKVCEKNPYKEYRQLNSREKLATTAKKELSVVMQKYHALEYELNHLEKHEKANLLKEVASARELEETVLTKLDDMKSRLQSDHKMADTLNDRRREIVSELAGDLNRKAEQKLKTNNNAQQLYNKHLTMTANHSKRKLIKIQNVFRKIADVTGLSDPQAILNKWMNKDNEEGALIKQRQEFQLKLAKLQEEKRNLQKELDSANFGDRIVSSHQIRHIDDLSFQAETKLKRNQEKYLKSQSLLKDVKGGVIHLATMLNLRSTGKLEHDDPEEILKVIREKVKELRKTQDNDDISLERLPTPPTNERLLVGRIVGKYQLEQEAETNKNLGVDSAIHTNMARYGLHVLAKLDELDDGARAITSPTKQPLLSMMSSIDNISPLLEQAAEEVIEDPPVLSRAQMKAQVQELDRRERTRRKKRGNRGKSTAAVDMKKETLTGTRRRVIPGAARRFTGKNALL